MNWFKIPLGSKVEIINPPPAFFLASPSATVILTFRPTEDRATIKVLENAIRLQTGAGVITVLGNEFSVTVIERAK